MEEISPTYRLRSFLSKHSLRFFLFATFGIVVLCNLHDSFSDIHIRRSRKMSEDSNRMYSQLKDLGMLISSEEGKKISSFEQSYGMIDSIANKDWEKVKRHAVGQKNFFNIYSPNTHAGRFWALNFHPNFSCPNDWRLGGLGDGGKWVCNPDRIREASLLRKKRGGNGCLVYSIGSNGNIEFEQDVQHYVGVGDQECEIHTFDFGDYSDEMPPGIHYHQWGFKDSDNKIKPSFDGVPLEGDFKTFDESVQALGHEGRVIDILKIDCEGCEYFIFNELLSADVTFNQVLIELHGYGDGKSKEFLMKMQEECYVTFHKEVNSVSDGSVIEYAFLKLTPDFFSGYEMAPDSGYEACIAKKNK